MAEVFTRTCISPWSITAENGDHFALEPGRDYTTGRDIESGECTVLSHFWVRAPLQCFTAKRRMGQSLHGADAGDAEFLSWLAGEVRGG